MTDTNHLIQLGMVLAFLMVCVAWLHFLITRSDNDLDWVDLVSIHGADGKNHADWTKIGQGAGVFVAVFTPLQYAVGDKFDPAQGAILMGAALLYLGGVAGYSDTLRAKRAAQSQGNPNA